MQPNEMSAYKGDKPYIFVSYAHKDANVVIPLIKALQDVGYRIWFDLGIEVGTEWSNNIANHLRDCSAFLFFTSQNSVKSENCLDEVAYAKSHNKAAVLVYLEEDVVLPTGTEMQTARFQRMYANRQADIASFVKGFSEAEIFDVCREEGEPVTPPVNAPIEKPKSSPAVPAVKKPKIKLGKGAYIGIAAALVAIIVAVVVIVSLGGDSSKVVEDDTPKVVTLSNDIEDHTFRLEGKVYQLPFSYSTLVADGWTIYSMGTNSDMYLGGQSDAQISVVKDGKSVEISIYNDGENAKKLKDCLVGGIRVSNDGSIDFCIAAEVTPAITPDEMIEKFGTPSDRSEYDDGVSLVWSLGELAQVKANIYEGENARYSDIQIMNYVLSKEKFETKKEAPKFLESYSAPSALGDELYSGIFGIDGANYELPVPLREFINNGWKISSGSGALISGAKESYTLSKDSAKISVEVVNVSLYKTTPENCIVTKVDCDLSEGASLSLPGGVSLGMSHADFKKVAPKTLEVYEGTYSTSYSYSEYDDRDYYLSISVDSETGKVNRIYMTYAVEEFVIE